MKKPNQRTEKPRRPNDRWATSGDPEQVGKGGCGETQRRATPKRNLGAFMYNAYVPYDVEHPILKLELKENRASHT